LTEKNTGIIDRDVPVETAIFELQSYINAIEKNTEIYEERNFDKRIEVIEFIGFHVIEQVEELLRKTSQPDKLVLLKYRAEKVKAELEEIDNNLFKKLQANLTAKKYTGEKFKNLVNEYFDLNSDHAGHPDEPGYDNLDIFINRLFSFQAMPGQTKDLEPEMVYYQKTPARIVFELAEKSCLTQEDVFFDLGSGLGQVAILINLLAGVTAKGVEFEPAFCAYAENCARELNLSNVTFINADARHADYSGGTIFFMFTPFKGEMLQEVLDILRKESLLRKIRIITYGPCTAQVALQSWLHNTTPEEDNIYRPGIFSSF